MLSRLGRHAFERYRAGSGRESGQRIKLTKEQ